MYEQVYSRYPLYFCIIGCTISSIIFRFSDLALKTQHVYELTPIQIHSIPHILNGNDIIISSKSGSGKTLCYAIPVRPFLPLLFDNPNSYSIILVKPNRKTPYTPSSVLLFAPQVILRCKPFNFFNNSFLPLRKKSQYRFLIQPHKPHLTIQIFWLQILPVSRKILHFSQPWTSKHSLCSSWMMFIFSRKQRIWNTSPLFSRNYLRYYPSSFILSYPLRFVLVLPNNCLM